MWTEKRISDLGKIITGSTPSTDNPLLWGEDIPFISPSDFDNDDPFVSRTERYLSTVGARTFITLPIETVLTTCIGSLGKMALTQFEQAVCNQQINALICNDENDPRFIFYAIKSNINMLKALSGATTIPIVNKTSFGKIKLKVPEKGIQSEIANILDTLDTQIRQTEAIIAKLQQVKQGLLHDLLTRGIDANGQLRPPRDQAPELYKVSPLGWIPREWDPSSLDCNVKLISGQHIEAVFCNDNGDGVPYFTGPADFEGEVAKVKAYTTRPQIMCKAGDILLTVKGSGCGKIAKAEISACISRQLMAVRVPLEQLDYWWSMFCLLQPILLNSAEGGAIPGLSRSQILGTPVAVAPNEERIEIGKMLTTFDRRVSEEAKRLQKLKKQKSGLMDDLLTGRIRVNALIDTAKAS